MGYICRAMLARALVLLGPRPGCSSLISNVLVTPPNRGRIIVTNEDDVPRELPPAYSAFHFRCDVGSPPASLSTWVIDPAPSAERLESGSRGTVLLLHGFYQSKGGMLRFARSFLEEGYRTVLVDLRGHGRSTGEQVSFGALEAQDLSDLLDELERSSLLREPVGVFGISYGAAVAIQVAGRDPRVRSVVAVAPFTSLQDVVPRYVRLFLPVWGWFATRRAIQNAVLGAGLKGGFDPERASPLEAIRRTEAHTLLIHGEDDFLIRSSHSKRLHAARPDRSELILVPGVGHHGLFRDPDRRVSGPAMNWFERWLVEEAVPAG